MDYLTWARTPSRSTSDKSSGPERYVIGILNVRVAYQYTNIADKIYNTLLMGRSISLLVLVAVALPSDPTIVTKGEHIVSG